MFYTALFALKIRKIHFLDTIVRIQGGLDGFLDSFRLLHLNIVENFSNKEESRVYHSLIWIVGSLVHKENDYHIFINMDYNIDKINRQGFCQFGKMQIKYLI